MNDLKYKHNLIMNMLSQNPTLRDHFRQKKIIFFEQYFGNFYRYRTSSLITCHKIKQFPDICEIRPNFLLDFGFDHQKGFITISVFKLMEFNCLYSLIKT